MNMKKYIYILAAILGSAFCTTGCIEETFPSAQATPDQIQGSTSLEYLTNSLPAFLVTWNTYGADSYLQDWGYPCQMYMREVMGEDFPMADNGYNYWVYLENATSLRYMYYYPYYYYYSFIKNANNVISRCLAMNPEKNDAVRHNLGIGLGYRALLYLDLSRLYEYRQTGVSSLDSEAESKGCYGITVPIVKESTTKNELTDNPCAPFHTMYRFILSDLDRAEECLKGYSRTGKSMMDQNVIYGLKTRLWLEMATRFEKNPEALAQQIDADNDTDGYGKTGITSADDCYKKAAEYAFKVISNANYTPLTQDEWSDPQTGFNTLRPSWLLGTSVTSKEQIDDLYWNTFFGYMASEADWGMTNKSYYAYRCIGEALFSKISDSDWRKNIWVSPEDAGKTPVPEKYRSSVSETKWSEIPAYANLKFRPGSGSLTVLETGLIASLPLMRVKEMYFDYFEAVAHTEGAASAASKLQEFLNTYRYTDGSYTCKAEDMDSFISELMVQRRIEFWGEGINYFDYKRLALAVTRKYEGTNYEAEYQLNSIKGYVAPWMNYMIPESEKDRNQAVIISPNPSGAITAQ